MLGYGMLELQGCQPPMASTNIKPDIVFGHKFLNRCGLSRMLMPRPRNLPLNCNMVTSQKFTLHLAESLFSDLATGRFRAPGLAS